MTMPTLKCVVKSALALAINKLTGKTTTKYDSE
jgi:hypothetical protein